MIQEGNILREMLSGLAKVRDESIDISKIKRHYDKVHKWSLQEDELSAIFSERLMTQICESIYDDFFSEYYSFKNSINIAPLITHMYNRYMPYFKQDDLLIDRVSKLRSTGDGLFDIDNYRSTKGPIFKYMEEEEDSIFSISSSLLAKFEDSIKIPYSAAFMKYFIESNEMAHPLLENHREETGESITIIKLLELDGEEFFETLKQSKTQFSWENKLTCILFYVSESVGNELVDLSYEPIIQFLDNSYFIAKRLIEEDEIDKDDILLALYGVYFVTEKLLLKPVLMNLNSKILEDMKPVLLNYSNYLNAHINVDKLGSWSFRYDAYESSILISDFIEELRIREENINSNKDEDDDYQEEHIGDKSIEFTSHTKDWYLNIISHLKVEIQDALSLLVDKIKNSTVSDQYLREVSLAIFIDIFNELSKDIDFKDFVQVEKEITYTTDNESKHLLEKVDVNINKKRNNDGTGSLNDDTSNSIIDDCYESAEDYVNNKIIQADRLVNKLKNNKLAIKSNNDMNIVLSKFLKEVIKLIHDKSFN